MSTSYAEVSRVDVGDRYLELAAAVADARAAATDSSTDAGPCGRIKRMTEGPYICHVDDLEWQEVRVQEQDGVRASVWNRFVDVRPERTVIHTRYDAGMVLPRHSHKADEVVYVLEGEVLVGDVLCRAGSVIVLETGDSFGPLIAGDEGAVIFEVFHGPPERASQDRTGLDELLAERSIVEFPSPAFDISTPRDPRP